MLEHIHDNCVTNSYVCAGLRRLAAHFVLLHAVKQQPALLVCYAQRISDLLRAFLIL